ncbi:MAG: LysR family transcriptional regulator [Comamonadaceae bacterium]|nr:MAG: LysR family transcriptional regulator [Comamonadaceae bacterium]
MTTRRLPPLITIRAFDSYSRMGSVRAAADDLSVSHTVVSRHIQNLEEAVGVKLVRKSGRGLALTREGERFAVKARRAFDILAEATAELAHERGDAIHICCMAGLATHRLLARLPDLEASLTGTVVILQPTTSRPDFAKDEADAEIIYLESPNVAEGLQSELLMRPRIVPVASPVLLRRFARVGDAEQLLALPLLHEKSTALWESWLEAVGVGEIPPLRGARLWHGHLTLEAARLGQGVALVSDSLAADRIASGELVEVIESDVQLGGYYFVAPIKKWNDPALAKVRAWLATTLRPAPERAARR